MCSSRLALDQAHGLVVVTTTDDPFTATGTVFLVLDGRSFGLVPERGRPASAKERAQARPPYESPRSTHWSEPVDVPDDMLDERAALAAARREQQRQPVDLIGRAA